MEYVPQDLLHILQSVKNGTLLSETHIITIIYNSLCALKFLHDCRILHRDIKPANLLVNLDCSIKITDFGLARLEPIEQDSKSKSKSEKESSAKTASTATPKSRSKSVSKKARSL